MTLGIGSVLGPYFIKAGANALQAWEPEGNSKIVAVMSRLPEASSLKVAAELHASQTLLSRQIWVFEEEVGAQRLTRSARGIELTPARRYVKLGFGGAHTDSNHRLMYTSA